MGRWCQSLQNSRLNTSNFFMESIYLKCTGLCKLGCPSGLRGQTQVITFLKIKISGRQRLRGFEPHFQQNYFLWVRKFFFLLSPLWMKSLSQHQNLTAADEYGHFDEKFLSSLYHSRFFTDINFSRVSGKKKKQSSSF